ncbi:MAG: PhzF family phenazine biosynthesis protein [Chloroflexi bacterium]|nr:PhzF family phenazine biosynthesis protein [Chloroflexota bacterium]
MTRRFRFRQVDVFADRPLSGNPLAVFTDATGLTEEEMQRLAREMNLSETTFVLPPSAAGADAGAAYRMRIFTPGEELPAAGHPALGTAWVLADDGRFELEAPRTDIRYETALGVQSLWLEVRPAEAGEAADDERPGDRIGAVTMVQSAAELIHVIDPDELDELGEALEIGVPYLRWKPKRGAPSKSPAAVISTGLPFLIVPVQDLQMLEDISNERSHQIADFASTYGSDSAALVAPGNAGAVPDADVHVRVLVHPRQGITEDPATGSAAGPIAVYLGRLARTRDATYRLVIEQGVEVGRPSRLVAEVDFDGGGQPGEVRVSGCVAPLIEGWVELPD